LWGDGCEGVFEDFSIRARRVKLGRVGQGLEGG